MRVCGACRGPLRHDESLSTCWLSSPAGGPGYYQACPRCCAAEDGREVPPARTYPADQLPASGAPFPICGLCREALFDGERCKPARLETDDLAGAEGIEPGAYEMCPRCWARWEPVILARRVREGTAAEGARFKRLL